MAKKVMTDKKWYVSKTLVVNFVAILAILVQLLTSVELPIDPEIQALILAIANAVLRFATNKGIARSLK